MAYWALPFIFQESDGTRPIRAMMIGHHKSSKLGIPSKPDITFITEGYSDVAESFPFLAKDITKIIAGVMICADERNIIKKAETKADLVSARNNIYREFNTRRINISDIVQLSITHGFNWRVPLDTHLSDIHLLKGAYSYWVKKGYTVDVDELIAIGKDIRHGVPVILFKKSWKNFTDAIWLWGDIPIHFIAGLLFLIKYPPDSTISFLSLHELKIGISSQYKKLKDMEFINIDVQKQINYIVKQLKIST